MGLAGHPALTALSLALTAYAIGLREQLLDRGGRRWSYDCPEACCAPGGGTPVPGGVGPMTIAVLLRNTLVAAHRRAGLADPAL